MAMKEAPVRSNLVWLGIGMMLLLAGCAPKQRYVTKSDEFPLLYDEQPRSLLILPPINESTDAEAKDHYLTTVEMPFALHGYYVFPMELVSDIMKQEGVYDTELLYGMPPQKFREYFGADAVLYTRIKKWDVSYAVVSSTLTVSIGAEIISTKTAATLWHYTGTVVVNLTASSGSGTWAGLLADAIATAINTAAADYVTYARQANRRMIYSLPYGPYHEQYLQDRQMQLIDQTPAQ